MTEGLTLELKTVAVAVTLAVQLIGLGWFAASVTGRVGWVELDQKELRVEQKRATSERVAIREKLAMIDRFGDSLVRIEKDIQELKRR